MDTIQATKKLYEDFSKLSITETSDLLVTCKKEELNLYKQICENVLQQRQRKAIEEHRF